MDSFAFNSCATVAPLSVDAKNDGIMMVNVSSHDAKHHIPVPIQPARSPQISWSAEVTARLSPPARSRALLDMRPTA